MIVCGFKKILKDKRLSITKVSKDTGLSRVTLTALANGTSKGIRFDTLNKLTQYLNVNVDELITHIQENKHEEEHEINLPIEIVTAVSTLKRMSEQETDKCKKLDIDYVITILTNKPYGSMPF
ncbi:helix-turn-helix domain-containing protein [Bacillus cytotoxicus]|uniref:Transcriptional regulator, XRE family n=1 Tax=Bacillus cytotoxicus (strain DSM 22905 / CIP 110041 / 391-98 / NVH 391-98) TaxID=315749 RepID=A7GST5_BACCN|nr:helix-turn-helix transcriptional regulator [Bacillus cytotoxicus]ABS23193.1 putative transcriptional regulator, XRE family [Bacillus cytotoxicus NVH 391-98]AWC33290.1 XRE family transcriptional regulator [Bacillus cytotoxicus]AWC37796.1 XRE family transcriptional regulator [Bacillus cytotoxicus]AWC37840.1 XRE family transcriptional regulator [Bacillus cytotoxicus]AWC62053.1 XRE family transcriptional regulator [Bacillus cytotoxicus]